MAEYAAVNPNTRAAVAIFSMEMPSEQVITRMLASIGGVPLNSLRSGKITDEDWVRITGATSQLSEAKIFVDETPALNPTELRARARRVKREHGLSRSCRLLATDAVRHERESRDRDCGGVALAQGACEGTPGAGDRTVAAEPRRRAARA
jgi:replicative DNA helicase